MQFTVFYSLRSSTFCNASMPCNLKCRMPCWWPKWGWLTRGFFSSSDLTGGVGEYGYQTTLVKPISRNYITTVKHTQEILKGWQCIAAFRRYVLEVALLFFHHDHPHLSWSSFEPVIAMWSLVWSPYQTPQLIWLQQSPHRRQARKPYLSSQPCPYDSDYLTHQWQTA